MFGVLQLTGFNFNRVTMVLKRCFVSNCSSNGDQGNAGQHFFTVPKGKLAEWQAQIPHKTGLVPASRFCARHFNEGSIKKGNVVLDQFHPLKQWRLHPDSLPELYLGKLI